MDAAQWPQGIGVVQAQPTGVENTSTVPKPTGEKKPRPQKEQALNCPRCNSTNTKFCYYNNYSLSQPRYFCKTCRRYWTEGGSLRNVPVGGGSRKNKRSSSSSSSSSSNNNNNNISSSSKKMIIPDLTNFSNKININHGGHDLNLAYNPYNNGISEFISLPLDSKINILNPNQNPNNLSSNSSHLPVMELIKTSGNMIGSKGLGSFMSNININNNNSISHDHSNPHHGHGVYPSSSSSGLAILHDFKGGLSFSLDGIENGLINGNNNNNNNIHQDHSSRIPFPFEELKRVSTNQDQFEQDDHDNNINRGQGESNGFWNGMLAGGTW